MNQNNQLSSINRFLQKQLVQKYGVMAVAALVIGSVAYFGTSMQRGSHAAVLPSTLSLSPATGTLASGSTFTVAVIENSNTDTVNSVQASLTYNPALLQFVPATTPSGFIESSAWPVAAANSTATAGVVRIARGTAAPATATGSNTLVTMSFKVLGTGGTASLSFDPAFSYMVRSTDNTNILATTTSGSYNLKLPTPALTTVTPASGSTAGGTTVTINGSNFVAGATVTIGGVAATGVSYVNASTITAVSAAHPLAGLVDVSVINPDMQIASKAAVYSYLAQSPTVTSLAPFSGPAAGSTSITISGTGFVSGATVSLGGTAATGVVFVSSTALTAIAPAHTAGSAAVQVKNPDGQTNPVQPLFTYTILAPTVTTISPTSGSISGGTAITITGTNFAGINDVNLAGLQATAITVVNSTTLTAITPAHAAGAVTVTVGNSTGKSTLPASFTYNAAAPVVLAVNSNLGTANGGTVTTISGANFVNGATVTFGLTAATNVVFVSSTTITAVAPAHAAGAVTVSVMNPDTQKSSSPSAYTYLALGDANNDGRVNAIDLSIMISHDAQNYAAADFNGDGTVGSADLAILLGRWTW